MTSLALALSLGLAGLASAGPRDEPPVAPEGPEPTTEPEPATKPARPRPFVQGGLGGGLVMPRFYNRRKAAGGLSFAVEAGAVWNPLPRLRLGIGAAAQASPAPSLSLTSVDLLAKLRIGVGTSRVWGYGIVGAGLSLVIREDIDVRFGPAELAGLGVRGRIDERVSLGLDVESTMVVISEIGRLTRVTGLVVVEVRFGS